MKKIWSNIRGKIDEPYKLDFRRKRLFTRYRLGRDEFDGDNLFSNLQITMQFVNILNCVGVSFYLG